MLRHFQPRHHRSEGDTLDCPRLSGEVFELWRRLSWSRLTAGARKRPKVVIRIRQIHAQHAKIIQDQAQIFAQKQTPPNQRHLWVTLGSMISDALCSMPFRLRFLPQLGDEPQMVVMLLRWSTAPPSRAPKSLPGRPPGAWASSGHVDMVGSPCLFPLQNGDLGSQKQGHFVEAICSTKFRRGCSTLCGYTRFEFCREGSGTFGLVSAICGYKIRGLSRAWNSQGDVVGTCHLVQVCNWGWKPGAELMYVNVMAV